MRRQTEERLNELTPEDLGELRSFAERRCVAMRLNPDRAEELAQEALTTVLVGLESCAGRHPKEHEVADKAAFRKYLNSVICSLVEVSARKSAVRAPHAPVSGTDVTGPHGSGAALVLMAPEETEQVEMRDFKREFFRRLRATATPRHMPTINGWEQVFEHADRIPLVAGRQRKYVREVRELAQPIALELGLNRPAHRQPRTPIGPASPAAHATVVRDVASEAVATMTDTQIG